MNKTRQSKIRYLRSTTRKCSKNKYLFILFQGSGTNIKTWNEYTQSKFLSKLKLLGTTYVYQDKIHNIWHYDQTNPERKDFSPDIDFDLSYVRIDTHIKMVYADLKRRYGDLYKYKLIPVGWSAGCYLALYFAQFYQKLCKLVVLLDSALWTPNNMKISLNMLKKESKGLYPITNAKYRQLLEKWKHNNKDIEDAYKINGLNNYIRSLFISKHLKIELPVPTVAFINIQRPEKDEWSEDFNNKNRLEEMRVLQKHNPDKYMPYIFTNKTHYIFDKKQPANTIIHTIENILGKMKC